MKHRYFTEENISEKALSILSRVEEYSGGHRLDFKPEKSALLVLDMQKYFLSEDSHAFIPSATAIVPGIVRLMEMFAYIERPVIFTRHLNNDENSGMMSKWWRDLIRAENPASEIIDEIDTIYRTVIQKSQYDAFYKTVLHAVLKEHSTEQVVVTGVMTHLCAETTARSAFVRGYEVFLPVDGTADYNEEFHLGTMRNASHGFAVPCLLDELVAKGKSQ